MKRRQHAADAPGLSDGDRQTLRGLWLSIPVEALPEDRIWCGRDEHPALTELRGWVDRRSREAYEDDDHVLHKKLVMLRYALLHVERDSNAEELVAALAGREAEPEASGPVVVKEN